MEKLPPREKIVEAYSAIVDERVNMLEGEAYVSSSNGEKEYHVTWIDDVYSSTDSATYWQGYAGYPVIAVLMIQGELSFNSDIASLFSGINWTELNKKHKRNYSAALDEIVEQREIDKELVNAEIEKVYSEIEELPISVKRRKK